MINIEDVKDGYKYNAVKILPRFRTIPKKRGRTDKRKTNEQYTKELAEANPTIECLEIYQGINTKINHQCKVCGHIWLVKPLNLLIGKGCPKCAKKKQSAKRTKTTDQYVSELKEKNIPIIPLEEYKGATAKIQHQNLECDHIFEATPSNILSLRTRCPICKIMKIANGRLLSNQEYLNRLKEIQTPVIPLEEYKGINVKIYHQYPCGHTYKSSPATVLNGSGCDICNRQIAGIKRRKTDGDFKKECNKINPNIKFRSEYNGARERIECECLICGHIWNPIAYSLIAGTGCPICGIRIISEKCSSNHREFLEKLYKKPFDSSNIVFLSEYTRSNLPIHCKCNKCNGEWYPAPSSILAGENCPYCRISKGEKIIKSILNKYNIEYIPQMKYDDLYGTGGKLLSYDFYLPTYNLLCEFNGIQHEKPIEHFGGEAQFKIQQEHDKRKREYAKEHSINLLEIWYYNYDNIEEIITNYLNLETLETAVVA